MRTPPRSNSFSVALRPVVGNLPCNLWQDQFAEEILEYAGYAYRRACSSGLVYSLAFTSGEDANWLVSDIYKANVYDNFENKLGVVTDLVLDNDGQRYDGRY
jgi:hypothetical protein